MAPPIANTTASAGRITLTFFILIVVCLNCDQLLQALIFPVHMCCRHICLAKKIY
jgi:hypothetical protein